MDPTTVQTVVLAAGSSVRMGHDKLLAPFAGVPLARRVVDALGDVRPLVIATPAVAEAIAGVPGVRLVVTAPTAGPSLTLGLAHAAIPAAAYLAVVACDLPFLDADAVRALLALVPADADLAFPIVGETPGHPVVWSPRARARIPGLGPDEPPVRLRRDPALHVVAIPVADDRYVTDVDTPAAWAAAERYAESLPNGRGVR